MEEFKYIEPYPMMGPGSENFPASPEMPEGVISVTWKDKPQGGLIDVKADIVYQSKSGEDQHLHLFLPMNMFAFPGMPAPKYPLIAHIPGSAWHRQNLWMGLDRGQYFAARGYAVAIIEYRPTDIGATFPAQVEDTVAAVKFLIAHADEYGIDASRIAIWGDSSGGNTAVNASLFEPDLFRCTVDWFGPMDITIMNYYPSAMDHYGADSPEGMLIGGKPVLENLELAQKVNPINRITPKAKVPPMIIMHGTKDNLVPFNQSVRLYEKLKECKKDVTFYRLEDGGHGSGGFVSDEAFELVHEFIGKYLK